MPSVFNLQRIRIHTRLRIFFATVLVLILAGSVLSVWQFRSVADYARRLGQAERRASQLLRLNSSLLNFMNRLHRAAEERQADRFQAEAPRLLREFRAASTGVDALLTEIAQQSSRHSVLSGGIRSILNSLPTRVTALSLLAREEDWVALHARLLNQTDNTDDIVAALTEQVDIDLERARKGLAEDLNQAQSTSTNILLAAGAAGVIAATVLGALITRSIMHPLSRLTLGARALAAGDFKYRIPLSGDDDLSDLSRAFNHAIGELAQLFEEVQRERTVAETAQLALQERAQELARANTDLEQFAYSASHDLKEPLRIIALYSQLLQRKYTGRFDAEADEYMGYLYMAARQMEQLIQDLLTYTQTAQANKAVERPTNVDLVFERVLTTLQPQIEAQRAAITADPLPNVQAHEIHVHQLLQNLLANALKYSGDKTPIVHVSVKRSGEYWQFSVQDNGIGIEPQYARQVFGIFKRLHGQKYSGTGIGLAICQRIIDRYGGSIWVESELGNGSTFRFTLPATAKT